MHLPCLRFQGQKKKSWGFATSFGLLVTGFWAVLALHRKRLTGHIQTNGHGTIGRILTYRVWIAHRRIMMHIRNIGATDLLLSQCL